MICRAELHQGRRIQFVPGWDCHGLPIEVKALEKQRASSADGNVRLDAVGIRKAARELAVKTVKEQKKGFRDWAVMGDWDNAWTTMDKEFEMSQLGVFLEMVKKGLIFRRFKPVYWSPSSKTALAEAELEYNDAHVSTAAYVKFAINSVPEYLRLQGVRSDNLSAVIWTTTPWTLPANAAIAVGKQLEYTILVNRARDQYLLVAKSRLGHVVEQCGLGDWGIAIFTVKGEDLIGATYKNDLRGASSNSQPIIAAEFVSADSGTGLVHLAPGHGMDDYEVCVKQGIPAFAPVDDSGCFTSQASPDQPSLLEGIPVLNGGSNKVIELLGDKIIHVHKYKHKYPYDWRSKLPVIVRATEQWFADVGSIKDDAVQSLADVKFIPDTGRARLESFIKGRSEWCISRQRAWGVPIPALYDADGKATLTDTSVSHIISVIQDRGIDAWWTDARDDPAWVAPGLTGSYTRGKDTMDVWFDSGSSWTQTPVQADVYSEGTDQHRGWFQSSLLTHASASGRGVAPYKTLITHGFTLDQEGRKMSKSIGNTIAPHEIMDGSLLPPLKIKGKAGTSFDSLGADALRLWVASSDYTKDVVIGQPILKAIHTSLLKNRTTLKMLLGSMHSIPTPQSITKIDEMAIYQLTNTMTEVQEAWKTYEFHRAVAAINRYINADLSAFYLEAIKDRVYCGDGGGVLYHVFQGLCQMLAPVTPMLVEEAWTHRPAWLKEMTDVVSPFYRTIDEVQSQFPAISKEIGEDFPYLNKAYDAIKTAQEEARTAKLVGSSLQSSVVLLLPPEADALFRKYEDELDALFVVSNVSLNTAIQGEWQYEAAFETLGGSGLAVVLPAKQPKCPRCWRYVAPAEDHLCGRCEDVVGQT